MAAWNEPLPNSGVVPVNVGDSGHAEMHTAAINCFVEVRSNVDAIGTPPTVDTLSGAGAFGKTLMKAGSNGDAWLDLGVAQAVSTALSASDVAAVRAALGASPVLVTGRVTLGTGGTAVVPAPTVTADTVIQLTVQQPSGQFAAAYVAARTPGTSFTVQSESSSDTSVIGYTLVEPAS